MNISLNSANHVYNVYKTQSANNHNTTRLTRAEEQKDSVVLSSQAKDFSTAMKAIKGSPDVREEKVNSLKEQVQTNSYDVKSTDIAAKMLSNLM